MQGNFGNDAKMPGAIKLLFFSGAQNLLQNMILMFGINPTPLIFFAQPVKFSDYVHNIAFLLSAGASFVCTSAQNLQL